MSFPFDRQSVNTPVAIAIAVVTVGVLVWAFFAAFRPLPGRDLTIATGPPGSAYAQFAERYREILARDGVRLRFVPTLGAVENLNRLRDPNSGVDAGFVQSGTTTEQESPELASLGTVFYEPMWVFCRCSTSQPLLQQLLKSDSRVSIGSVGSGTRPLALKLLALAGVDPSKLKLFDYTPDEAARHLIDGDIEVAMTLHGWEAPAVQRLLHTPGIELVGFKRASAYVAIEPQFSKLTLPEGVADLSANRPPADVPLIASKASLAVRDDLHPALQYLLLHAAIEVHSRPSIFERAGEFPAPESVDLPLSSEARHMYKSGPSILQRTLPFWLAELLQRLLVILLPVAGILYPLWSLLPRFYRWQMQRRIFRHYGELRFLEIELWKSKDPSERTQIVGRIDDLDRRVVELKMPRSFSEMTFNLRRHIRALQERANALIQTAA
jgi:TRAP-type uncharacterized transport system substrate-binding protein